jgi:predicted metal-dependent phosphoesterase TrpH
MSLTLDLHTHSCHSPDSRLEPAEIVRLAKARGLNGVAICDHMTVRGGLAARAANDDPDFCVIPGVEYATEVGHVVGLFVERELTGLPVQGDGHRGGPVALKQVVAAIHEQGGIAVLAHPFQARLSLPSGLFAGHGGGLDALEGFNSRANSVRNPHANARALTYAAAGGIPLTGSSDAHHAFEVGRGGCRIAELSPGATAAEVRQAILDGLAEPFGTPGPRWAIPATELVKLRRRRHWRSVPKVVARLLLTLLGPLGLWLENRVKGPLPGDGAPQR